MKRAIIYFCNIIQIQADKIIKKNRVPVNKELLTGTWSLSIRIYWQGQSLSIRNYWQGWSLSIRNYWQGRSLSITSSINLRAALDMVDKASPLWYEPSLHQVGAQLSLIQTSDGRSLLFTPLPFIISVVAPKAPSFLLFFLRMIFPTKQSPLPWWKCQQSVLCWWLHK